LYKHDLESPELPRQMRVSYERLKDDGIYLLENGVVMFLWIGQNVPLTHIQNLFGSSSIQQMNIEASNLIEIDSPISINIRSVIKTINEQRNSMLKVKLD
jgi:protein transport protein SEC24